MAIWPVQQPSDWLMWVNDPQTAAELDAIRVSVDKGKPFGDERW
jgi:putative transposase